MPRMQLQPARQRWSGTGRRLPAGEQKQCTKAANYTKRQNAGQSRGAHLSGSGSVAGLDQKRASLKPKSSLPVFLQRERRALSRRSSAGSRNIPGRKKRKTKKKRKIKNKERSTKAPLCDRLAS